MENEEKNIEENIGQNGIENSEQNSVENSELSLEDKLAAQDEFAFLDEQTDFQEESVENIEQIQEDELGENFDSVENSEEDINLEAFQQEIEQNLEDEAFEESTKENAKQHVSEMQNIVDVEVDDNDNSQQNSLITVRPVKFQQFEDAPPNRAIKKNLDIIQDISMHVSVELGRTKSSIREVMELEKGSIVELDKIAGEQVEIYVNQKLVAKGEVIVIEDKFGVRVTNTASAKPQ